LLAAMASDQSADVVTFQAEDGAEEGGGGGESAGNGMHDAVETGSTLAPTEAPKVSGHCPQLFWKVDELLVSLSGHMSGNPVTCQGTRPLSVLPLIVFLTRAGNCSCSCQIYCYPANVNTCSCTPAQCCAQQYSSASCDHAGSARLTAHQAVGCLAVGSTANLFVGVHGGAWGSCVLSDRHWGLCAGSADPMRLVAPPVFPGTSAVWVAGPKACEWRVLCAARANPSRRIRRSSVCFNYLSVSITAGALCNPPHAVDLSGNRR